MGILDLNIERAKELKAFAYAWHKPLMQVGTSTDDSDVLQSARFANGSRWLTISVKWGKFNGMYGDTAVNQTTPFYRVLSTSLDDVLAKLQEHGPEFVARAERAEKAADSC